MHRVFTRLFTVLLILSVVACANVSPYDYTALKAAKPRSILIIPPINQTTEVLASDLFMSAMSQPLSERGYYVFPVAVVQRYFHENGLPGPEEMNSVELEKLKEQFGADAVLYTIIHDWGQKYEVLSSTSTVKADVNLIDSKNGALLWSGTAFHQQGSGNGGGGLAGALLGALVTQLMSEAFDPMMNVSTFATHRIVNDQHRGLLPGPYFPPENLKN
ncbi:DUF799 domain-containing protein [Pseudoteredinibacter isoporae]|uniref:Lipoprotein n=1 Tax=Pseudoteredinibacter isoporae TaxID=570281 RepID=A0A7X0JRC3_9GAMM|nr:GNA1162 family protein [Pseudoteredinibacter isoporae]MBB6520364.1 hypothetical protein [Pseudoteredinibacter isoporae]